MESLFLYCAMIAGGLLMTQMALMLFGMGHDADVHDGSMDVHLDHADGFDHAGAWFVGVLSFRAVASAVLMFGVAGLSSQRFYDATTSFFIASACGVAMLFGVAYLLRVLYRFASDGTVKAEATIGRVGQVYLTVPGGNQGHGKVTIAVQGRTMEYEATTHGESLPTGTPILVVQAITDNVLEVERDETPPETPA